MSRRKSRELALQVLFQWEFHPELNLVELGQKHMEAYSSGKADVNFCKSLLSCVADHLQEIDPLISSSSPNWPLKRMSLVDKSILRLGVAEMVFAQETVDPAVVIDECVEMAKKFGADDSYAFVNGILDKINNR